MATKAIITNKSALITKYGTAQTDAIIAALDPWIAADRAANIVDTVVFVDDKIQMAKLNAQPVTVQKSAKQNKVAIDGIYHGMNPSYMVILGATDIIPHQSLVNPVAGDTDSDIPADIPYACEAAYSRVANKFIAPTRVVSRLPDITGYADGFGDFLRVIANAASLRQKPLSDYTKYFAVTADAFKVAEGKATVAMFGDQKALQLSPPKGPGWSASQYGCLQHYTALHGGKDDPKWYGDNGSDQPVAFIASQAAGKINLGNVLVTECCYGAQLYNPALAGGDISICNTYMNSGACGFYGSSNVVWAGSYNLGASDTMIIKFMQEVRSGESLGAACLAARQLVVSTYRPLGPQDLKVLVQWNLLGDASAKPVAGIAPLSILNDDDRVNLRRQRYFTEGHSLESSTGTAYLNKNTGPTSQVVKQITDYLNRSKIEEYELNSYDVKGGANYARMVRAFGADTRFHLVMTNRPDIKPSVDFGAKMLITFQEQAGQVVSTNETIAIYRDCKTSTYS